VAYELSVLTGSVASFIYSLYISSNSSTKRRKIKFLKHKYTIRANINNYKNQFAAPRIIGNLLMLDIAFINIIFGNQSSGLYSAAARLRTVLPLGIQSIADISLATPIGKKNLKNILFQKDFVVIFFGTLVAAIILEVFTPLYISIIFGYQYRSIVFLTRIFILTAIISGILAIARSLLIAWKLESIITNAYLVMFTFLLPIFFLGVLYFGVKWAAISQLIAYFLLTLFLCKRIVRLATVK
jgi:O-antigen/teichoic acid export membrane protein